MLASRSVSQLTRLFICVAMGLGSPVYATPPSMPPSPIQVPGARVEEIQETTVGTLSGVSVGVANMWERDYVDAGGVTRKGLTARLDFEEGTETRRVVVGEGSVLPFGADRWEVVTLRKTPGSNGTITLRLLSP